MDNMEAKIRERMREIARKRPLPSTVVAEYNRACDDYSHTISRHCDIGNLRYITKEAWRRIGVAMGLKL